MNKLLRKDGNPPLFYQFFRKMKLTILIVTVSILSCFSAETYSQTTKLTIAENNSTLLNVLRVIEGQSEFKFFYNEKVDVNKAISIEAEQKSIADILDQVLAGSTVKYKVIGRQIALYDKDEMEPFISEQQGRKVTGHLTDQTGASLPGVSVVLKGTTTGTITDGTGKYSIANIPENATLQFSFIGMKTQEIKIGNQTIINVSLAEETTGMEEVVVIGYGTQKLTNVSGAISTIKAASIEKLNPVRVEEALQGGASGVTVIGNGSPGSKPLVLVRGIPSFSGTDPIVIIDGIPQTLTDLNAINPADIESVSVLKDAATTAIYGVKGGNGVIVITTKIGGKIKKLNLTSIHILVNKEW